MVKINCKRCGNKMPLIPDQGGFVCLTCGLTIPVDLPDPKLKNRWGK